MRTDDPRRATRERLLLELTSIPTAAGREDRVIQFIRRWVEDRPRLSMSHDEAGNLIIEPADPPAPPDGTGPIILEAHLDHPAFVVDEMESPTTLTAAFRGGVMAPYFIDARVSLHGDDGARTTGTIVSTEAPDEPARPFRVARIEMDEAAPARSGDMLTWDLPPSTIENNRLHAPACDDLAAVASALCALDELLEPVSADEARSAPPNLQLLLTRAEEVGFVGAIAACKLGTIPPGARIIALENSRSFADSPIGAGPIVRVGDRLSVFSPSLTAAVAKLAQRLTGEPERKVGAAAAKPKSSFRNDRIRSESVGPRRAGMPADAQRQARRPAPLDSSHSERSAKSPTTTADELVVPVPGFAWQRKLMPGGACEATAFQAYGHEATCVCLPLGNYHNMGDLDAIESAVKAETHKGGAPIKPEVIAIDDFHNLVELLIACGRHLGAVEPLTTRLDKLYDERRFVLNR